MSVTSCPHALTSERHFFWCTHLVHCKFSMHYILFFCECGLKIVHKHSFTSLFPCIFWAHLPVYSLEKKKIFCSQKRRRPSLFGFYWTLNYHDGRCLLGNCHIKIAISSKANLYLEVWKEHRIRQWDRNTRVSIIISSPNGPHSYRWTDLSHKGIMLICCVLKEGVGGGEKDFCNVPSFDKDSFVFLRSCVLLPGIFPLRP